MRIVITAQRSVDGRDLAETMQIDEVVRRGGFHASRMRVKTRWEAFE